MKEAGLIDKQQFQNIDHAFETWHTSKSYTYILIAGGKLNYLLL